MNILTQLDEEDARLSRISSWLDMLDAQLDLSQAADDPAKIMLPIVSIQIPEYA